MSAPPSRNDIPTDVDGRIARRLGELRYERGYSLEDLAARSGVSRSMISRIERGEVSATAVVLNKLAMGLDVLLPVLLGFAVKGPPRPLYPVARRNEQERFTDAKSGYQRRTLTPPGVSRGLTLSEARLPPRARITFEKAVVDGPPPQQQVWVIKGELHVQLGDTTRHLTAGDCMAMTLDQPVTFQAGASLAHYVVATSNCP